METPVELTNHHYAIRPQHFRLEIRRIIDHNAMNIPIPSIQCVQNALEELLKSLHDQTQHLHDTILPPTIPILYTISTFINDLHIHFPSLSCLPSTNELLQLKQILRHTIVSTIDKNANQLLVLCPVLYHEFMKKTFVEDPHYTISSFMNQSDFLSTCRIFFDNNYGSSYSHFNEKGTFGYAYIVPKHKDLSRCRPIVSFYKHPLKHLLRLVGCTLQFLLLQLNDSVGHYILFRTMDLKIKLQTHLQSIQQQFPTPSNIEYVCITSDIKNMFTQLQHTSILDSILWLIETVLQVQPRSSKFVVIDKHDRHNIHFFPSYNEDEQFIMFDITTLIPTVVQFDLNTIHFTVGNLIRLQQTIGAPMGGILSAYYAIVNCAHSESRFHSLLIPNSRIFGCRYMDDLLFLQAIDKYSKHQQQQAQQIIQRILHHCYDTSLELELTCSPDGHDRQFTYLDCILSITNESPCASIVVSPYLKNSSSIRFENKQTILHFQHWNSYSPSQVKYGVIKSTVLRYHRNSSNGKLFLQSILELQKELHVLQYPPSVLIQVLQSCYHMYQLEEYRKAIHFLQAIQTSTSTQLQSAT